MRDCENADLQHLAPNLAAKRPISSVPQTRMLSARQARLEGSRLGCLYVGTETSQSQGRSRGNGKPFRKRI